jgi:hypothetical protein
MCSPFVRKEANRFNWIIKGQLIDISENDKTVERLYDSYFKRLWGNIENYLHEEGFEQAYEDRVTELRIEEMSKVAVLGYD